MGELVTGGNVRLTETVTLGTFVKRHRVLTAIVVALPVLAIISLILLIPMVVSRVTHIMSAQTADGAVHATVTNIEHRLAHGGNLHAVVTDPQRYIPQGASGYAIRITDGSCGHHDANAYTVTAVDATQTVHVYTSRTNIFTTTPGGSRSHALQLACIR